MKQFYKPLSFLLVCCLAVVAFWSCSSAGQTGDKGPAPTIVYVVRHAEKVTDNPQDQDPNLTEAGNNRALALRDYLQITPLHALFATPFQRTQQTLLPLAAARSLEIQTYDAADFEGLAQKVKLAYLGQTVVIAGHSNTVLSIIEALGAKKPVDEVKDHQYDYLFKVTLEGEKNPRVEVLKYGAPSDR